jgi:hypothetical protein
LAAVKSANGQAVEHAMELAVFVEPSLADFQPRKKLLRVIFLAKAVCVGPVPSAMRTE